MSDLDARAMLDALVPNWRDNTSPPPVAMTDAAQRLAEFCTHTGPTLAPYQDHNGFGQHDRLRADIRTLLKIPDVAPAPGCECGGPCQRCLRKCKCTTCCHGEK